MSNSVEIHPLLASATLRPYWEETVPPQKSCAALTQDFNCDLAIVGGGYTGLWTALMARRRNSQLNICVLEAGKCGDGASGRNGGFCAPSISHGVGVALDRWCRESDILVRLGRTNLDEFARDVKYYGIDAEFEREGKLTLAEKPWQIEGLRAMQENCQRFGIESSFLTGDALREKFDSPVYSAALFEPNYALLNPARMVAELRRVALENDITIYEETPVQRLRKTADRIELEMVGGAIKARQVILATNAANPLRNRLKSALIPIYDYALVTRPLTDDELSLTGWSGRHGVADSGNQFHYVRKTKDNRILWGGHDAIYHFGSRRDPDLFNRPETFNLLAGNFARALPQLKDVAFTHAWGGIIDVSARTTFFTGLDCGGRLAYAMGFTGQGVSASRFAALTMLDLLEGRGTERTRLDMLRRRPFPFPPEPARWLGIRWAQHDLAREDQTGKRSLLLRSMDAISIGFAS